MSTRADWTHLFARRQSARGGEELAAILAGVPDGVLALTGGFPNPSTFATDVLGDIAARVLRDEPGLALQYTPVEGIPSVREYLAERQESLQGRRPEPAELMVTSGGMECIALACAAMLEPGDAIAVEGPTYLGALMAFRGAEADVHEIPMDEDGLVVDALAEAIEDGLRPKLLYVIPEYQNPTGRTLPLERREALVELCRRHGVLILEDVAYRELAWGAEPLPTLWSLAPDVVVQAGTFSKVFFPGVRLGWASGPEEVVAQLAAAKANTDQCASALGQRMVEEYGRGGHFERELPGARELYASHWRALDGALREHMPEGVAWTEPAGGFLTWVKLPPRARRDGAPRRGHRGRRRLRAGRAVLRLGPRRRRAAAVLQRARRGRPGRGGPAARVGDPRGALARAAHELVRALEVRAEQLRGGVAVAALERGDDLAVLGDEALDPRRVARDRRGRDPLVAVAQAVVLAGQEPVAGRFDDRAVELPVGPGEAGAALERLLLLGDVLPQRGGERRSGVRGAARAVLLDQHPRLQHVLGLGRRDRHDERAAAGIELEQSLGLELHEGLPDGRAADVQALGDLVLAEQGPAREAAVEQARLDVVVGQLGGGAPAREQLVLGCRGCRGHRRVH